MKFVKLIVCSALMLNMLAVRCEYTEENLTRLNAVPSRGLTTRIKAYVREHAVCLFALGAALSYIAINSYLDAMRPNPYEGPLKEAHAKIAELEKALIQFDQLYRVLGPVLRMRG
ncbi:MAG: hypothetical protein AB7F19_01370 [Candidatus Babeliales bacterium]